LVGRSTICWAALLVVMIASLLWADAVSAMFYVKLRSFAFLAHCVVMKCCTSALLVSCQPHFIAKKVV
jgi:hypothetical protein